MIEIVNTLLECAFTGLVTALCIWGLARLGKFPILYMVSEEQEEDEIE